MADRLPQLRDDFNYFLILHRQELVSPEASVANHAMHNEGQIGI